MSRRNSPGYTWRLHPEHCGTSAEKPVIASSQSRGGLQHVQHHHKGKREHPSERPCARSGCGGGKGGVWGVGGGVLRNVQGHCQDADPQVHSGLGKWGKGHPHRVNIERTGQPGSQDDGEDNVRNQHRTWHNTPALPRHILDDLGAEPAMETRLRASTQPMDEASEGTCGVLRLHPEDNGWRNRRSVLDMRQDVRGRGEHSKQDFWHVNKCPIGGEVPCPRPLCPTDVNLQAVGGCDAEADDHQGDCAVEGQIDS